MNAGAWVALAWLALPVIGEAQAGGAGDAAVTVLRGDRVRAEAGSRKLEQGVIVMRPAPGSFMRETTRLAAEAEARSASVALDLQNARWLLPALQSIQIEIAAGEPARHEHLLFLPRTVTAGADKPRPRKIHPVSMEAPR